MKHSKGAGAMPFLKSVCAFCAAERTHSTPGAHTNYNEHRANTAHKLQLRHGQTNQPFRIVREEFESLPIILVVFVCSLSIQEHARTEGGADTVDPVGVMHAAHRVRPQALFLLQLAQFSLFRQLVNEIAFVTRVFVPWFKYNEEVALCAGHHTHRSETVSTRLREQFLRARVAYAKLTSGTIISLLRSKLPSKSFAYGCLLSILARYCSSTFALAQETRYALHLSSIIFSPATARTMPVAAGCSGLPLTGIMNISSTSLLRLVQPERG